MMYHENPEALIAEFSTKEPPKKKEFSHSEMDLIRRRMEILYLVSWTYNPVKIDFILKDQEKNPTETIKIELGRPGDEGEIGRDLNDENLDRIVARFPETKEMITELKEGDKRFVYTLHYVEDIVAGLKEKLAKILRSQQLCKSTLDIEVQRSIEDERIYLEINYNMFSAILTEREFIKGRITFEEREKVRNMLNKRLEKMLVSWEKIHQLFDSVPQQTGGLFSVYM